MAWTGFVLVFVAGLIAAIGTSLGAVPLFWVDDIGDRLDVGMWGFAGGLMASASVFGLLYEAWKDGSSWLLVGGGIVSGVILVVAAHQLIDRIGTDFKPKEIATGDFRTIVNIVFVLFVHSFPEGIAIGVSFAQLNKSHGLHLLGFTIPVLAIIITGSLAIHNLPEGIATAIPMKDEESISNAQMWGAAFVTSIPQPIGAVVAFYFVRIAQQFLGYGYGFAAGAMLYLVVDDVFPDGLEAGEDLPNNGVKYLAAGAFIGFVAFIPLIFIL